MLHGLTTKKNLTPLYFHWSLPHFKYLTVHDGLLASNIRGLIKANRNQAPMVRKYSNCVNMPRRLWGIPSSFCFKFLNSYHVSHFSFISFFMAAYFFVLCVSDKWVADCEKKSNKTFCEIPPHFWPWITHFQACTMCTGGLGYTDVIRRGWKSPRDSL